MAAHRMASDDGSTRASEQPVWHERLACYGGRRPTVGANDDGAQSGEDTPSGVAGHSNGGHDAPTPRGGPNSEVSGLARKTVVDRLHMGQVPAEHQ
ncbi:hypothetical protein GUJ93_ZPchr0010g7398 [Zizania palustris]|uniref:Uncharacterized protein n=1 Tax=Zizania palustris TaxID=103762 RepID=A0A8J5SZ49_ZIZPA|nr:hypothetical protein GUJ93_ZPchr0010g7398 [Zizania palustris]